MLTGSLASSFQGEPRSTHDIDIVVELDSTSLDNVLTDFQPPRFYVSRDAALEAIKHRRMFNVLDTLQGDKVDFWLLTDDIYDQTRFQRRQQTHLDELPVWMSSPEDTILMKLRWCDLAGGSERQFHDALSVYEVQHASLDMTYLEQWIERLSIGPVWERLLREADTDLQDC